MSHRNLIFVLIFSGFCSSCQFLLKFRGKHNYAVPQSFEDTIKTIIDRLNDMPDCNYIVYRADLGNCFGPSFITSARFIWSENGKYFQRDIFKPEANRKKVIDNCSQTNKADIFQYCSKIHLDTVTSLPKAGASMDPASECTVIVKNGYTYYKRTFEMTPFFTTKDTMHPLFAFIKLINQ